MRRRGQNRGHKMAKHEAKLFCIFHRYVEGLTPSKRKKAWRERNQWLLDRKKAIDAAAAEYEGGSMAPYAGGQASIDFTKKRIRAIEELLIKQDPKGN